MAGPGRLHAVLPLLLLLGAAWPTAEAAPAWDDPFLTADTSDKYIEDFDGESLLTIYEDIPLGNKIGVLHITAQQGDTVTVTQVSNEDVQLGFNGSNTEQEIYILSPLNRETKLSRESAGLLSQPAVAARFEQLRRSLFAPDWDDLRSVAAAALKDSISVSVQLNGGLTQYFTITVADVNDNTPMFDGDQGSQISLNVPENKLNDSLLTLTATDDDEGATEKLTYTLDTAEHDDLFNLKTMTTEDNKPACQLRLIKELDYETRPLYKLTITVTDTADVRGTIHSSSVTVFVNVEDVGDTAPRWLLPPMASDIDENTDQGNELFTVLATDGDTSVDNDIRYSIVSQDPAGFVEMKDTDTGKVTLTKDLDREDPDLKDGFISIVLQAREAPDADPDQPCSNITCVNGTALITVNDLDDNLPEFDQTEYAANMTEGYKGSLSLTINVTDKDETPLNNQMTLSLEGAPEGVELATKSGAGQLLTDIRVVTSDSFDYETESQRVTTFTVVAKGNKPKESTASATVTITLKDSNDNTPVFSDEPYIKNVKETDPKDSTVITAKATDGDASSEFGTDSIRYSLTGGGQWSDSITVDEKTGEITLAKNSAFDREQGAVCINYTIRATDSEGSDFGSKSATALLTIKVDDVDDTPPQLSVQSTVAEVLEQASADIEADISASDEDASAVLQFSFNWTSTKATKDGKEVKQEDYDYQGLLQIDNMDGDATKAQLRVKGDGLDREKVDTITLAIVVTDTKTESGEETDQASLTVNILDINDNSPEFVNVDPTTPFNVTENMPKTSTINQAILARDVDKNNTISYSLTGDDTDLVAIDSSSGQLSVKDSIDREKKTALHVTVTATDSGVPARSSSVEISIEVLDQNDNGPEWDEVPSDLNDLTVSENNKSALVYTLKASDKDEPDTDFSKITYSLSEDGKKNFTVDASSGELTVNGELDREVLADQNFIMTIQVFAGDGCDEDGNCAHKKEGLLRVTVLDVNDCPPVFPESDDFLVEEMETIDNGGQLGVVRATDKDEEDTAASKLTYNLKDVRAIRTGCKDTAPKDLFKVTTDETNNQANIKANQDLQGCWGDYNITLEATDGEAPNLKGTGVYKVRIKDKNDAPTMVSPEDGFTFDLPEDTYSGSVIPVPLENGTALTVRATDQDDPTTDNAKLTYRLTSDSTPGDATSIFYLSNGTVMLKSDLDRESPNGYIYTLKVEVNDRGDDQLTDSINIVINITDVDEFPPKFVDRNNNATQFTEENEAKSDTQDITSLATDDDDTDIIYYFIVGGDSGVFELVDPTAKQPQLRNLKKLDREQKASYHLILQTTRDDEQPSNVDVFDPDDPSQLNLTVIVKDINDMTPDFGNRRFMGGIAAGDPQDQILRLESDDPDVGDKTTYSITSDFSTSDPSIANISQPFKLNVPDTAGLMLNFDVSEGMDGYFDFEVTAEDTGGHSSKTSVRIFIIIEGDRVKFVFANQYSLVQAQQEQVADILTTAFSVDGNKYVANIETVLACPDNPQCTNMVTHFIDDVKVEPVLADVIINLQFKDGLTDGLVRSLGGLGLNLTAIGDTTVAPPDDSETVYQMLLIVVASVLGGILALTCITSCMHTHKLRRQVKALSINAFGSRESGMQQAGLAVPGSNMFANQGANPIFTMDDKKPMDAESVSSGDSVLIGVEDDPEFANSSRAGQRRPAPSAPLQTNPAFQADTDDVVNTHDAEGLQQDHDDLDVDASPAVFDENSHHHMPSFDPDDDEDVEGPSPFGGGGGMSQNPLFGAGGGSTQNPLFGAEMGADGDLGGPTGGF